MTEDLNSNNFLSQRYIDKEKSNHSYTIKGRIFGEEVLSGSMTVTL